ncbi:MAG: 30S ribosomal protein S4 [Caldiserica bacterium]|nr:30S ribosomal protein S4 [Caldisericota bacterium]
MSRYNDPDCRLCRRELVKLYLKGNRCFSLRCPLEKKSQHPGQHGAARKKLSEYALRLREKQKLRRYYGILERQFRRYFDIATRQREIPTGTKLLQLLETRLDNVVYRLGFAPSRSAAHQLVGHGHFLVNGRPTNVSSYSLKPGDVIELKPGSRGIPMVQEGMEQVKGRRIPEWLRLDPDNFRGEVLAMPAREQIDAPVQEQLVVEFYSR